MSIEFSKEFQLPIFYNNKKQKLQDHIIKDLELLETEDPENTKPIYDWLVTSNVPTETKKQISEFYTTDVFFLQETQKLLKCDFLQKEDCNKSLDSFQTVWRETKGDLSFKDKYMFMTWPSVEFLNHHELFLQFYSVYTLASPVVSLVMPIFILITPFFMLKVKGMEVTLNDYMTVLKKLIQNHAVTKLFTEFHSVDINQKIYILASAASYFFSIYQNIVVCLKFYNNMSRIEEYFRIMDQYLTKQIKNMDLFLKFTEGLFSTSYVDFKSVLREKKAVLESFHESLKKCCYFQPSENSKYLAFYTRLVEIGKTLKIFYQFHNDPVLESALLYSFGFDGYMQALSELSSRYFNRIVNLVNFSSSDENKNKGKITKCFYAPLTYKQPVTSNISFSKSMIITGPNASGKTTTLKAVLINVIFSQQFGVGFYETAEFKPFDSILCYLNIPDTSGRDSLFQAEARRCKEILDCVKENADKTHFCVFDELYSGTNPEEAVSSATAFMKYLLKNKNVYCMLTTHYTKVCRSLEKTQKDNVENFHMTTKREKSGKVKFLYSLKPGISTVKGGFNVLSSMDYPEEILQAAAVK